MSGGCLVRASVVSTPLLVFESVSRVYRAYDGRPPTTAVAELDLTVDRGESVAVVGPSGAGKSTVARLALGLEVPDRGRVGFGGRDLASLGKLDRRRIGRRLQAVFQDPYDALDPRRPVWWSVTEPRRVHGLDPIGELPRVAARLLAEVELSESVGRRHPGTLSGGERQRVSIARAVSTEPEMIVLDEPVSSVDAALKVEILAVVDRLRRTMGTALLVVTHDLATASRLCDRIVVLDAGRMVESGPTDEVLARPRHTVTCALVEADRSAGRRLVIADAT